MENLNELIISLLSDIAPTSYGWFKDNGTHITFFEYNMRGQDYSDDELVRTAHSIQVDIWGYENLENMKKKIIKTLLENNFSFTDSKDLFEAEKGLYHKSMRFSIIVKF